MTRYLIRGVALVALLYCWSLPSFAMPMLNVGGCSYYGAVPPADQQVNCALSITGLDVSGSLYDVNWVFGSFSTVYSSGNPTFWGQEALAQEAATEIFGLLTSQPSTWALGSGAGTEDFRIGVFNTCDFQDDVNGGSGALTLDIISCEPDLYVPYQIALGGPMSITSYRAWYLQYYYPGPNQVCNDCGGRSYISGLRNWAVFTPSSAVPEPSVLALLSLGTACLVITRRRKISLSKRAL